MFFLITCLPGLLELGLRNIFANHTLSNQFFSRKKQFTPDLSICLSCCRSLLSQVLNTAQMGVALYVSYRAWQDPQIIKSIPLSGKDLQTELLQDQDEIIATSDYKPVGA
jgi:hypothetical protein